MLITEKNTCVRVHLQVYWAENGITLHTLTGGDCRHSGVRGCKRSRQTPLWRFPFKFQVSNV